ncbi:hypothetical protein NADFUDRAFT_50104 [Nadsonia fulvescens var. elongata DSM 6958]|uniref:Uncharacterized protein n=1 Tax=Nadsonia fulvescens var. elongata DSM 6958 TaxID=857566 RepID=A0A1E3PLL4_9ASCO|nr:hypothetical protein NADFUDRAFT_50104 [Nadsonia fulvescens var. elongata DSM 6958]
MSSQPPATTSRAPYTVPANYTICCNPLPNQVCYKNVPDQSGCDIYGNYLTPEEYSQYQWPYYKSLSGGVTPLGNSYACNLFSDDMVFFINVPQGYGCGPNGSVLAPDPSYTYGFVTSGGGSINSVWGLVLVSCFIIAIFA